jgi:arylsulfatase A-like enzyme
MPFPRLLGYVGAFSLSCLGPASSAPEDRSPEARPNILFILVDDQSPFDLKAYNPSSELHTPNLDRLAAEGVVFDGAYHMGSFSGAVCTPSRHMIMSGRTLWHLPISPWGTETCPPALEEQTLPAVFRRAGYATMRTCKTGNSYEAANRLFEVRHDATKRGGNHESGSAWHGDRVLDYLDQRQSSGDQRPFLIYFGFSHPHDTRDGRPDLLAKYGASNHTDPNMPPAPDPAQPALPSNWLPGHPFRHGDDGVRDEVAVSGVWKRRDPATIRNETGREFACAENIDQQVGRVLERLKASGELDRTYVIYTADHGMALGRHGLQGKQNLYEHTWRVPFLVKGPGIPGGRRVQGNIYLLDVLATLCDLSGIEAPETNEGTSFRPILEGRAEVVRDVLYGAYCGGAKPGMRAVRQGDWKLIRYEAADGTARETQLFHLTENPEEFLPEHHDPAIHSVTGHPPAPRQTDLADHPDHAGKRAELESLLLSEMRRLGDPWRFSDQPDDDLPEPPARKSKAKPKPPTAVNPAKAKATPIP